MSDPGAPPEALVPGPMVEAARRFEMHHCLGRGGFGEVYRASMISPGGVRSDVAVKILHAEVDTTSQAMRRLRDEGRLLRAIHHPSVLRVHDLCRLEGRIALVTEFIEGQDLDKCLLGRDALDLRGLLEVGTRVADALHAAYTAQAPTGTGMLRLVHRDVKPANIRIGRGGEVKLLDFGIARATNLDREAQTATDAMLGSYLYMAPERFLEDGAHGPWVDVFSLGCTLYEGIAGERLFSEFSLNQLYVLVLDPARFGRFLDERLDVLGLGTPVGVTDLLCRMLQLDPMQRPSHQEVARTGTKLMRALGGPTLDRWARARSWPSLRGIEGMLDGTTLVEGRFTSRPAPTRSDHPLPPRQLGAADTIEAQLELPKPAPRRATVPDKAVQIGLIGFVLAGAATAFAVLVLVVAVASRQRAEPPRGLEPPGPVEAVDPARPPATVVETVPAAGPASTGSRNAPRAAGAFEVTGAVVVELVGKAGTFRAGPLPAGAYDVRAQFETGKPESVASVEVAPGQTLMIKCRTLRKECTVTE